MLIKLLRASSFIGLLFLAGCSGNREEGVVNHHSYANLEDDKLLRANRYLIQKDMEVIKGYIGRHEMKVTFSDLGYYYGILENARKGKPIKKGDVVLYSYKVKLIDGTPLDSSGHELAQIVIDKSAGITGLHDGFKHFAAGDSLTLILPPHVAFGLLGDGDKIPGRATLVYNIRIKSVQ